MPVQQLNGAATQDAYADALTVVFGRPRANFTCHVSNAAIYYKLGYIYSDQTNTQDVQWEPQEHQLVPSLSAFTDAHAEGLPPNTRFAGIQVRSAAAGTPATVTVM